MMQLIFTNLILNIVLCSELSTASFNLQPSPRRRSVSTTGQVQNLGVTALKPPGWDRKGWEAFKYFLYNPETGAILTRTVCSWLKIILFYVVYYAFLHAFWLFWMFVFMFFTVPDPSLGPKYKLEQSLIGSNPGLGFRPRNTEAYLDSQMITLRYTKIQAYNDYPDYNMGYAERVLNFLENEHNRP